MYRRNTDQKSIIISALCAADHPTATELYESIHGEHPSISRATVFRVLSGFAEDGRVTKLEFLNGSARYDADVTPHAHCCCVKCGKVSDVFDDRLLPPKREQIDGFSISSASVEFYGLCPDCAKAKTQ